MCCEVIDLEAIDDVEDYELFDLDDTFRHFNEVCFDQTLEAVCVSWSKRLTLTAGNCRFKVVPNDGAYIWLKRGQYCEIRLSEPLLKYRSAKECKETLLHEMIHAHLYLTKDYRDVRAHGKEFLWHMQRVNEITGLNVTVYHEFDDEVEYHRKHVWRCSVRPLYEITHSMQGLCRQQPPYFGYLRRARNVPPGPRERWCMS
ncbi:sPRT domain containg protein [Babesia bigemina]|uniref:SPRT domain containg protein n=1 Tax=Babesia bigemina TaxID=5866 RepID=A0A061D4E3_BABBI|nr:sPRT domain containg protein [Babesia bigemina]CDR94922.1 sPRT domain containg protein [Babesia bigemina]|eukprot:XP_012767108.1 sPRT domain containg protein [Babesia bigemina]